MTWLDKSETVTGLVIKKHISPTAVRPEIFQHPYNKIVRDIKEGKTPEEIYLNYGEAYDTALMATEHINGQHDIDWIELLERSKVIQETGQKLDRISHKMQDGDWDGNLANLRDIINQFGEGKTGRRALDQIEPMEMPFVETGWNAYDTHLGGLPEVGLVIVSGNPGSGKTTWAVRLAKSFATRHKKKIVSFYSLEMIDPEIAMRFREVGGEGKYKERIQINCDPLTVSEVINDAARIDNLGLVIIDFADYLIRGEVTDSSMGEVYLSCAIGAKQLGCPIVLLAQYSRKYEGGIPRPYHIRYTSLAEILGWMLICLYNPDTSFYKSDKDARNIIPTKPGHAYALVWKVRGGFRKHPTESPGYIDHQFKGSKGWGPTGRWFHLRDF